MYRDLDDAEVATQLDQMVATEIEATTAVFINAVVAWLQDRPDAAAILEQIRERVGVPPSPVVAQHGNGSAALLPSEQAE